MTDKIRPGNLDRYAPAGVTSRSRAGAAAVTGSASAGRRDSVSLTGEASLLQEAGAAAGAAPGVDAARVAEVRQALRDGSYRIDPQMIASKMLKTEWELSGA